MSVFVDIEKDVFHVIGVMSGTSLDGLDIAYCTFERDKIASWKSSILKAETIPYSKSMRSRLHNAPLLSGLELTKLDHSFGHFIGTEVSKFIRANNLSIDLVGSHGHTVFHEPDKDFTLQIGNGNAIWHHLRLPVVADFRTIDVIDGGQGAPLVPIGDRVLYADYHFCLNMGGFANLSFTRAGVTSAFDIAPVNIGLNFYAEKLGLIYDDNGAAARSGTVNGELLDRLSKLPYYTMSFPKSLGREWLEQEFLPQIPNSLPVKDILATITKHAADMIANELNRYALKSDQAVLVTGGGAYNTYLMELLNSRVEEHIHCTVPDSLTINYKEAQIFALLGLLKIVDQNSSLTSVTGAASSFPLGVLYQY